jgi:hypothetical protein
MFCPGAGRLLRQAVQRKRCVLRAASMLKPNQLSVAGNFLLDCSHTLTGAASVTDTGGGVFAMQWSIGSTRWNKVRHSTPVQLQRTCGVLSLFTNLLPGRPSRWTDFKPGRAAYRDVVLAPRRPKYQRGQIGKQPKPKGVSSARLCGYWNGLQSAHCLHGATCRWTKVPYAYFALGTAGNCSLAHFQRQVRWFNTAVAALHLHLHWQLHCTVS